MKNKFFFALSILAFLFFQNCSSSKVLDAWKAETSIVDTFKKKKVLVIARTANDNARYTFENEIADALRVRGINASESYHLAPTIHPEREISEERMNFIKTIIKSEGYNAVVLTVIKDKKETVRTSYNGISMGASYASFYPGYYGGFYSYYRYPYAYGSYYNSFGGFIPTSSSTSTSTEYVLETVAYILEESEENQLVAVVTSSLDDPKQAEKTAKEYVEMLIHTLESPKK